MNRRGFFRRAIAGAAALLGLKAVEEAAEVTDAETTLMQLGADSLADSGQWSEWDRLVQRSRIRQASNPNGPAMWIFSPPGDEPYHYLMESESWTGDMPSCASRKWR